jgi:HEXXH motif-containing protein
VTSSQFEPDAARARALNRSLRVGTAESLEHILRASRDVLPVDEAGLAAVATALRGDKRFPPGLFGLYYDLVDAIAEDRLDDAGACFAAITLQRPVADAVAIRRLDDAELGAGMAERYGRMLDTDAANPHRFFAPDPADCAAGALLLGEATDLLRKGCPRVHAEFTELVTEIVMAGGTNLATEEDFLAGSTFTLWGALFVNPAIKRTRLSLVETLAHETAHSLLFGIQVSGPLVLNPDEERFASPLRVDPRPMDGVYHATFVSARMYVAMQELIAANLLDGEDTARARAAAAADREHFFEGLETVKRHARLTATGAAVMAGAEDYMRRAA